MTTRECIDERIVIGEVESAACMLKAYWRQEQNGAAAAFVASRYEQIKPRLQLQTVRTAVLRSFTVEPLVPFIHADALTANLDVRLAIGEFNAYAQEILDPSSSLYAAQPDIVILCVQTRDVSPLLWESFSDLNSAEIEAEKQRIVADYRCWVQTIRRHSHASVIIHNLECPAWPSLGVFDHQTAISQKASIQAVNAALVEIANETRGVYILDYDGLVARSGRERWFDERKWLAVRLPIQSGCLRELVQEWFRYIHPLTGKLAKAVVVDLDNTLWGGVVGEEGLDGIQLGNEHPGTAFRNMQRTLLDLQQRGLLLAVCSKNNPADVFEVFDRHPGMLIRRGHIAAWRVNWNPKSENLRAIAAELNIGMDSLAFIDDNPVEREEVRSACPEVIVIDLPPLPIDYNRTLKESPFFQRLSVSAEDRQRSEMYAAERQRVSLEDATGSREDFYRALRQVAEISPVNRATLSRIAQLTQKTNQFNVTTKRYSEQQIEALAARPGWAVYGIRVSDRFADNGLVGVAITETLEKTVQIDSFLLSCRVISRFIETALLGYLVRKATEDGAERIRGWFYPTSKNAPCREFYAVHGFSPIEQNGEAVLWEMDLKSGKTVACPGDFVRVVLPQELSTSLGS